MANWLENEFKEETKIIPLVYKSPEWFAFRKNGIGGSDSSTAIGLNKWKLNSELWEEKVGIKEVQEIDNAFTRLGTLSEEHITELFKIEHQQFEVVDHKDVVFQRGFMFASLDGGLVEKATGKKGLLEDKTKLISNKRAWEEWENGIPQSYYVQLIHNGIVTNFDFAILKVRFREEQEDGLLAITEREYRIEFAERIDDMLYVYEREIAFWDYVTKKKRPPAILTEI